LLETEVIHHGSINNILKNIMNHTRIQQDFPSPYRSLIYLNSTLREVFGMSIKKIVLAFDGSDGSKKALNWTIDFAKQNDAETHITTIFEPMTLWAIETASNVVALERSRRANMDELTAMAKSLYTEHNLSTKVTLLEGNPADAIMRYAKKIEADIIICGTRGYGEFGALLLGSVAHKLVTYAKIPVLVVK
jgi:nucleotide-binding universal stress UspA family protein